MDYLTLVVGILIFLYGVYSLIVRFRTPEKFGKATAMQERFGKTAGNIVHITAYVVMPIIFGIIIVIAGLNGISLLALIAA